MPLRYSIDFRGVRIHPPTQAHVILVKRIQYPMFDTIGQGLNVFALDAIRTQPNGPIGTNGAVALRALWLIGFYEILNLSLRNRRAVDLQHPALHLDLVTRKTDQALDIICARRRMAKHHHIAALGRATQNPRITIFDEPTKIIRINVQAKAGNLNFWTGGIRIPIGHFVDE